MSKINSLAVVIASAMMSACPALAGVTTDPPSYDFQWAVVDHPFNQAYSGPDLFGLVSGRGRVDSVYRVSKLEITTAQWVEFVNTFTAQPSLPGNFALPEYWGAESVSFVTLPNGEHRYYYGLQQVPGVDTGRSPVAGISWRQAAMYCNWLCNNKSSDLSAIMNGAYDVSTFGQNGPNNRYFTDQLTHTPGAKFWIPTLDEFLKAAYYDPNKAGENQPGWWQYATTSDTAPISGPPGLGQTMAGVPFPPTGGQYDANWLIPLGSYTSVTSPWGLWDVVGGGQEWLEDPYFIDGGHPSDRCVATSFVMGPSVPEIGRGVTAYRPNSYYFTSLRIASVVPCPRVISLFILGVARVSLSLRKREST